MSFDAGAIKSEATLDLSPFRRSVAQLRAEGRKLAHERFTAKLSADTGEGDAKVLQFRRQLDQAARPRSVQLTIDTAKARLALIPVAEKLDELQNRITTTKVDAKTDTARQKLEDLELRLKHLGLITSSPRVSVQGVDRAALQLEGLSLQLDRLAAKSAAVGGGGGRGGFFGALSSAGSHAPRFSLRNLLVGLSPTIAPVAGLAAGAASSLLTPIAAGGIGLGAFGAAAKSSYKQIDTEVKTLTADQKAYNNAVTSKSRAAALEKEKRDWAALGPRQQQAVTNVHKLSTEWQGFQRKLRPQSFGLIATGTDIARKGLHLLLPDAKAAGNELDALAKQADHALNSPFWHQFFGDFLPGQTHRALKTLGTDLGDAGTGLAHLVEKFAPLGNTLERDMTRWGGEFERWTAGSGPSKFVNWVQKNGPGIAHDLGQLASGVGGIGKALLPFGTSELHLIADIAGGIGDIAKDDPRAVKDIGEALLIVAAGLKAIQAAGAITSTVRDLRLLGSLGAKGAIGKVLGGGGGGGMAGCCDPCGGRKPGTPATPVTPKSSSEEEGWLSRFAKKFPVLATVGTAGAFATAGSVGLTYGADKLDAFNRILKIVLNPSSGYQKSVIAAAQAKVAAGGVNPHSTAGIAQTAQYFQHFGGRTGFQQGFTPTAPTAEQIAAVQKYAAALGLVGNQAPNAAKGVDGTRISMGRAQAAADLLTFAEGRIPKVIHTDVSVDTASAWAAIERVHHWLDTLHNKTISVYTRSNIAASGPGQHASVNTQDPAPTAAPGTRRVGGSSHLGRSIAPHHIPNFTGNQTPAPLRSTSSSSGSSGSSTRTSAASRSHGPSASATANVLAGIVDFAGLSFTSDLHSTAHAIQSGIGQMIDRLNNAVRNKYLTSDKRLVTALTHGKHVLVRLANQEADAAKRLSAARQTVSNLRSQASSLNQGTQGQFDQLGDLSQMPNVTSVAGLISVDSQQIKVARAFKRNLAILRKKGLSKRQYDELEQAGPGAAGSRVALLATATAGQIKTISQDTDLLHTLGVQTGQAGAGYVYGGRIASAQRDVTADRHDLRVMRQDTRRSADALEKLIRQGLKDDGTHKLLKAVNDALTTANRHLAELAGTGSKARLNQRTTPARA